MKRKSVLSLSLVATLILYSHVAIADVGVPMIFLGFPFAALVLVLVILIECWVYSKRLNFGFTQKLKPVAAANLVSTLVGYPLSWALLLGLEFITTRGSAMGLSSVGGKVIAVTLQAAWLIPYEGDLKWMVPTAGLVGLIPAFFRL
jgi:hypothetical protein